MKTRSDKETRRGGDAESAKRSLAAHKANWTRALRKAYPEGSPIARTPISSTPTAVIEAELLLRAIERTGRGIVAMKEALSHMQAKQASRLKALHCLSARWAIENQKSKIENPKGGAA